MIKNWQDSPFRRGRNKVKMIHYCVEVWGGKQIWGDHLYWPVFGSFEDWVCQALNIYVNSKEPFSLEESEYAHLWISSETRANLYPLKEKGGDGRRKKNRELEIPAPLPPYIPPPPPAASPAPGLPNPQPRGDSDSDSDSSAQGPVTRDMWPSPLTPGMSEILRKRQEEGKRALMATGIMFPAAEE